MCSDYATVVQFSGIEYWHLNSTDAVIVFSVIQSPDLWLQKWFLPRKGDNREGKSLLLNGTVDKTIYQDDRWMKYECGALVELYWQGKSETLRVCPRVFLSTTNSMWTAQDIVWSSAVRSLCVTAWAITWSVYVKPLGNVIVYPSYPRVRGYNKNISDLVLQVLTLVYRIEDYLLLGCLMFCLIQLIEVTTRQAMCVWT